MIKKSGLSRILVFTVVSVFVLGLSFEANAQRRKSTTKSARAAAKKKADAASKQAELDLRKGAEDVAVQIKNVTKFVFVLGGIASGIEEIDKDVKEGRATKEIADKNAEFKSNVIRSIRALRSGLMKLEIDFRAKPVLKPYSVSIEGIYADSAGAENLAATGKLNQSGRELLLLVEKMTDVLVEMP